ncbi:Alpha/beta hydrolase family [Streptoalloteichus tenebrarius]|uniref:Alpha/beta hydrolase family n=1 Tax=Streptoalloteichus tenebrarius (strain ATCC 17920 / DSM 40477 / JCM 4838 / CBS 697.72 / NBRC 16177 / NCIMB 11028 / NRRL B-12390 / A12253. 1 / ISP 5477) TaxID=1933 RepID=A0ABT1HZ16_STRSD|nr:hypothetical protein [Streptoalloteichus tenebrarius]MCP2260770.1 Alpha/beta hydrolase family [Streptoalloteichus tenebrarius]BFF03416.1 hypothetical protein GCM10020241_50910 [Streptoalloteichus tenebrarius]
MPPSPTTTVLVHSPFLGPSSLRPLAAALLRQGRPALVPDLRPALTQREAGAGAGTASPTHQRLAAVFASVVDTNATSGPLVLVGHSGAGPLLPSLAAALDRPVLALVLLDAELPTPGRSWNQTASAELVTLLRGLVADDHLPPWSAWFQPDPLPELVDDPALRERIAREQPRVPAAFLDEPRPDVSWPGRIGYLLLSATAYGDAARAAHRAGWPVRHLPGHHLASATEPGPVADALLALVDALTAG